MRLHYQAFEIERCRGEGNRSSLRLPPDQSVAIMAILDAVRQQSGVRSPQKMPWLRLPADLCCPFTCAVRGAPEIGVTCPESTRILARSLILACT